MTANQELWLQALESGEFRQAAHRLQDDSRFCCLGVACVIAEKAGVFVHKEAGGLFGKTLKDQRSVQLWLGLRDVSGEPNGPLVGGKTLVFANDDGLPFKEIAKMVRANPEAYFVPIDSGST